MARYLVGVGKKMSFNISKNLRGVFVGSGSDGMTHPAVCDSVLELTGKLAEQTTVFYCGTPTYDLDGPMKTQTLRFAEKGCKITSCPVSDGAPDVVQLKSLIEEADVIVVSGGNTLYAMDKWIEYGMKEMFRTAMDRGAVLTGGSCGAIAWFDAGHSDSADPDSFKRAMKAAVLGSNDTKDESSAAPAKDEDKKGWKYIRVDCLGFLPSLVCPHHDRVQSNGVLRAHDFDEMLLRHPGERGLCIDHWAALVVNGNTFSVLSLEGKAGSMLPSGEFSEKAEGKPGIFYKDVIDNKVYTTAVPASGVLTDILKPAVNIQQDAGVEKCRQAQEDDEATKQ